jgi:hypothetical protein
MTTKPSTAELEARIANLECQLTHTKNVLDLVRLERDQAREELKQTIAVAKAASTVVSWMDDASYDGSKLVGSLDHDMRTLRALDPLSVACDAALALK